MNQSDIIIDNFLGVQIPIGKYSNEYNALLQLRNGLFSLYKKVNEVENIIVEENDDSVVFCFGNKPDVVPQDITNILPCYFHWFGTSICNYIRLNGFIVAREMGGISESDIGLEPNRKRIKEECDHYIKSIPEIQDILKWRNKVAAHFALTDPRKDDNIATLEASIIYPVAFDTDRFRTGTLIFSRGDGTVNHESDIPNWSLTDVFEKLHERFWPDLLIEM